MDQKIIFAIIGTIINTASFFPYLRDIFLKKTKPHLYTWFVWMLTQGTAAAGIWYGHGGIGGLELTIGTIFVTAIFLFSIKFGTKNINKFDAFILIAALLAIVVWWKLNNPMVAILMVCAIDILGYLPSFRKSYQEPWTETVVTWIGFVIGNFFAILALSEYNILTLSYLITISVANIILILICLVRRKTILLSA